MPVDNQLYNRPEDIWWNEQEPFSMLRTMLNPARFGFFRAVLTDEGRIDPHGRTALDVGCGGGLLAEECARLGLLVTGVDPSTRSVRTAQEHAKESDLTINYLAGAGELLPFAEASYDVVFCCDVLEHLENPTTVIAEISRVLKPGGFFLYDTINRTLRSKLAVIGLFQQWRWTSCAPPDLHDWNKFIKPRELREMMAQYGLDSRSVVGMKPQASPIDLIRQMRKRKRGQISYGELGRRMQMRAAADLSISYMGWAVKRA
jgi:2-polyprenyl-6-hydroxyphenyl methylase / 3-demethylubiquinone-9 3-methyltransferase